MSPLNMAALLMWLLSPVYSTVTSERLGANSYKLAYVWTILTMKISFSKIVLPWILKKEKLQTAFDFRCSSTAMLWKRNLKFSSAISSYTACSMWMCLLCLMSLYILHSYTDFFCLASGKNLLILHLFSAFIWRFVWLWGLNSSSFHLFQLLELPPRRFCISWRSRQEYHDLSHMRTHTRTLYSCRRNGGNKSATLDVEMRSVASVSGIMNRSTEDKEIQVTE